LEEDKEKLEEEIADLDISIAKLEEQYNAAAEVSQGHDDGRQHGVIHPLELGLIRTKEV